MKFMTAVLLCVCVVGCMSDPEDPNRCSIEWGANEMECETNKMEIGRNHIYLSITFEDHRLDAVFHGWFPEDLSDSVPGTRSYITLQLPGPDYGWCDNDDSGLTYTPPSGSIRINFIEEGGKAEVEFLDYISCDGTSWQAFIVSAEVDVVWMEE